MERQVNKTDGRKIRQRRESLGLSRQRAGEAAGVSGDFVQTVENAGRTMRGVWLDQPITPAVQRLVASPGFDAGHYSATGELIHFQPHNPPPGTHRDGRDVVNPSVAAASGDLTRVDVDELGEVLRRQGLNDDQIRRVRDFVDFTRQRP